MSFTPKSFSLKTIRITITLGEGLLGKDGMFQAPPGPGAFCARGVLPASAYGPPPGDIRVIEGLACTVDIQKSGLPEKNSARICIWGLNQQTMKSLTCLSFNPLETRHNLVTVEVGEKDQGLSVAFIGEISLSYADFNQAPDPCMIIEADSGTYPAQKATPVTTTNGFAPAENLFANLAREAGYALTNQGVTAGTVDVWLPGSPMDKMRKLAADLGIDLIIDDDSVVILPAGKAREGYIPLLSANTGLIGYPTFTQDGIACRCLYNPNLQHGGLIQTESVVPEASGIWKIYRLSHSLSAYKSGPWESRMEASYYYD